MADKIRIYWDDDDETRFCVESGTGWTWQDFIEHIDQAHDIIAAKEHDANIIMWFKSSIPPGKDATPALEHAGGTQPPNLRHTVIVNASTRFLDILVKNSDRQRGWVGPKIVQTMDDARAYLATLD